MGHQKKITASDALPLVACTGTKQLLVGWMVRRWRTSLRQQGILILPVEYPGADDTALFSGRQGRHQQARWRALHIVQISHITAAFSGTRMVRRGFRGCLQYHCVL